MRSFEIASMMGREIIDSRGFPTVEAEVVLSCGASGVASVPSGASTGQYEAHELRDKDSGRFGGKGVLRAVENINGKIAHRLVGESAQKQIMIDQALIGLDASPTKNHIGANATLAVSLACAHACANALGLPLYEYLGGAMAHIMPVPMMNILNGGAHASNNIDIQEFMIMPVGASSFAEGLRWGVEVYQSLKALLAKGGYSTTVGDEGGFAPNLDGDEGAVEFLIQAIKSAGFSTDEIKIALDAAASEWWQEDGSYLLPKRNKRMTREDLITYWSSLCERYPIISIEDGLSEHDFDGWRALTAALNIQLVGDDLFVTNTHRLKQGIGMNAANAILIKPNQIGTLSETFEAISMARRAGYNVVISHRSGETEDTSIADIAVASGAGQIKTGAPARSERTAKYNRLLRIQSALGDAAEYPGASLFEMRK